MVWDKGARKKAVLFYDPKKHYLITKEKTKITDIEGIIYTYKEGHPDIDKTDYKSLEQLMNSDEVEEIDYDNLIEGDCLEYLKIGNQTMWTMDKDKIEKAIPVQYPIPSDVQHREDIDLMREGKYDDAQKWFALSVE